MSLDYRVGDVFDRLAEIPDGSIDLIVTSPPFLALRSYLPADHPDKSKEIGSEPTPAEFIDTLLALTAEWGRVLAPHGSICVELGDTFSGGGGENHLWDNGYSGGRVGNNTKKPKGSGRTRDTSTGWPLAKSLTGIPTLYPWSLAYGRNLLTGNESPAGQWRIRNVIVWARPNPPVGALGDKFRPATSYITVACKGVKRYFDLDAVRTEHAYPDDNRHERPDVSLNAKGMRMRNSAINPAGAPPLDWHADDHPEDGDWLWKLSTQPYKGKVGSIAWVPIDRSEAEAAGVHADDIRRKASPDCLRHGGLPGQVPKALRDARAAGSSTRTSRSGDRPDDGQLPGFVPTDQSGEHSTAQPAPRPAGDPAATTHSNPSRRTGRDPATTQPGTPSARTTARTARTSASPESSGPDHGSDESSTSPVDSSGSPDTQTPVDTADTRGSESIPCTCSFERRTTEYSSHYATYPLTLPTRLIEAMCPLKVCQTCGKPSERMVETTNAVQLEHQRHERGERRENATSTNTWKQLTGATSSDVRTLGWTDCGHDNYRTGVVLDPFAGSGTTLQAAQNVGRHAIGIDLDDRNAELARERVGMFLTITDSKDAA